MVFKPNSPPKNRPKIKLITGLGNPGPDYENTYHNAGFLLADYLKKNQQIFNFPAYAKAPAGRQFPRLRRGSGGQATPKILKSEVYMNESGVWVKKILKKYNLKPEEVLIAHDDSDITLGSFKLSFGRGSAGHKGVESIIKQLGTKGFWRLRIGVRPRGVSKKASDFILKKFVGRDKKDILAVFKKITESPLLAELIRSTAGLT